MAATGVPAQAGSAFRQPKGCSPSFALEQHGFPLARE